MFYLSIAGRFGGFGDLLLYSLVYDAGQGWVMKSLMYGGAAAALLIGLAPQVHAEIAVRESPVHAVPMEDDDAPLVEATSGKAETAAPPTRSEPAPVKALAQPKAPPAQALTPEEAAFFTTLGGRVTDAASAYENFVRRAGAIDPAFSGAASVQRAVKIGAAYQPHQLEEGMIAYAALIALRNPQFVEGVRAMQNTAFADGLASHPERVMQVRGAAVAAADATGVLRAQAAAVIAAGAKVTKAAYDIQAQSWSKSPVADPRGVLDAAKTSADETRTATVPSKARLLGSLAAAPQSADAAAAPSPDVVRGLALAALAILGRTGDGMEAQYVALLDDPSSEHCLQLAKLNLNQCLAVAGPNYEDAYCAGRHAVSDTGKCISAAADSSGPALDSAPAPKLQEAEAMGREQAAVYGKPAPKDDADDDDDDDVQTAPAPALAAAPPPAPTPAPAPAPRQYAEVQAVQPVQTPAIQAPAIQAPPAPAPAYAPPPQPQQTYNYARNDYAPPPVQPAPYQTQAYPAYSQPQYSQPQYAQPQYAQPQYSQPQYSQPQYAQPQYQYAPQYQPQYAQQYQPQPYQQSYAQPYPQAQYAPQPYAQPQYAPQYSYSPYPTYSGGQTYYPPQPQGYPAYRGYYSR
jgi:hypothetical protein